MVQSNKYYKSRTGGVKSEVGLTNDERPFRAVSLLLFQLLLLLPRAYELPEVMWYEPLYNKKKMALNQKKKKREADDIL